jgi:S-adenosylmethionine hydrolase
MLTQRILPQKIVVINIHDRLPSNATDLDVFKTVACHLAKGGTLNVIGKEIQQLKPTTELQPIVSKDGNSIKGNVIYIDHFGNVVVNVSQKQFMEVGKGRMFEIDIKPKPIKSIQSNYSAVAVSDKFPIKYFEGEQLALFNEVGFLEIALFRSNPSTVGSAQTLLGIGYRDTITINFK